MLSKSKIFSIPLLIATFFISGCYTSFVAVQPTPDEDYVEEYIEYDHDEATPRIVEYRYSRPRKKIIHLYTTIGYHYRPHDWWLYDYHGPVSMSIIYRPYRYDYIDYWDPYYWVDDYEWACWDWYPHCWWDSFSYWDYHPVHWIHPIYIYYPYDYHGSYHSQHYTHHPKVTPPLKRRSFTRRDHPTEQNPSRNQNNHDQNNRRTLAVRSPQNSKKESPPLKRRSQRLTPRNQIVPDHDTPKNRRSTSPRTQIVLKEKQSEYNSRIPQKRRIQNDGSSNTQNRPHDESWGNRSQVRRQYQQNPPRESSRNQNNEMKTSRITSNRRSTRASSNNNSHSTINQKKNPKEVQKTSQPKTNPKPRSSRSGSTKNKNIRNDSNHRSSKSTASVSSRKSSSSSSGKAISRSRKSSSSNKSQKSESKSNQKSSRKLSSSGRRR